MNQRKAHSRQGYVYTLLFTLLLVLSGPSLGGKLPAHLVSFGVDRSSRILGCISDSRVTGIKGREVGLCVNSKICPQGKVGSARQLWKNFKKKCLARPHENGNLYGKLFGGRWMIGSKPQVSAQGPEVRAHGPKAGYLGMQCALFVYNNQSRYTSRPHAVGQPILKERTTCTLVPK